MDIKVFNEKDIQTFLTDKKHIVISIQDPNTDFVKLPNQKSRIGYLSFNFFDLDKDVVEFPYSHFLFEKRHAKKILRFIKQHKNEVELICINCVAGISRSAGVAGALSKIYNGTDKYFFDNYLPNMRVYRMILNEYEKGGK